MENGDVENNAWQDIPSLVTTRLIERREMLLEYFSMEISPEGGLIGIPLLIKGYTPSMTKLPRFLMRLGPCVNWNDEEECFKNFLQELATFYIVERLPNFSTGDEPGDTNRQEKDEIQRRTEEITYALEHVIFPAFRARLIATKELLTGVVEVADLKGLYRVFERC